MGKLQPVAKCPAGNQNRILQAQSANLYAEVNATGRIHASRGYHEPRGKIPAIEARSGRATCGYRLPVRCSYLSLPGYFFASFRNASANTLPSRVAKVGAMSAGVADSKYSPG